MFALFTLSQTSPCFYVSTVQSFENTVGKKEIACNQQFLTFPQCFLPIWRVAHHLHEIRNCRLQTFSVERVSNLLFRKGLI